jgi:HK97 family phage prohead protease
MKSLERRIAAGKAEVRTVGEKTQIVGYGASFNVEAVIGGNFRERILPGAFTGLIGPGADVRSLFNHDSNFLLGRSTAGTLVLSEDATGLRYEVTPPASRGDVLESVTRGDVTGSSFGFRVKRDEWTKATRAGELPLRTIHEFAELVDVGPVTYPAYSEASAEARDTAASLVTARAAMPAADVMTAEATACAAACQACIDACAACIAACGTMLADADCGAACRSCVDECADAMKACGWAVAACQGQDVSSYDLMEWNSAARTDAARLQTLRLAQAGS